MLPIVVVIACALIGYGLAGPIGAGIALLVGLALVGFFPK